MSLLSCCLSFVLSKNWNALVSVCVAYYFIASFLILFTLYFPSISLFYYFLMHWFFDALIFWVIPFAYFRTLNLDSIRSLSPQILIHLQPFIFTKTFLFLALQKRQHKSISFRIHPLAKKRFLTALLSQKFGQLPLGGWLNIFGRCWSVFDGGIFGGILGWTW